jgi:hypothetical protein
LVRMRAVRCGAYRPALRPYPDTHPWTASGWSAAPYSWLAGLGAEGALQVTCTRPLLGGSVLAPTEPTGDTAAGSSARKAAGWCYDWWVWAPDHTHQAPFAQASNTAALSLRFLCSQLLAS